MRRHSWVLVAILVLSACAKTRTVAEREPPAPQPSIRLLTAARSDGPPVVAKVDEKTGAAWYRKTVGEEYEWAAIADASNPPRSDYQFSIVIGEASWNLVRLDVHNGRGWGTESGEWREYGPRARTTQP